MVRHEWFLPSTSSFMYMHWMNVLQRGAVSLVMIPHWRHLSTFKGGPYRVRRSSIWWWDMSGSYLPLPRSCTYTEWMYCWAVRYPLSWSHIDDTSLHSSGEHIEWGEPRYHGETSVVLTFHFVVHLHTECMYFTGLGYPLSWSLIDDTSLHPRGEHIEWGEPRYDGETSVVLTFHFVVHLHTERMYFTGLGRVFQSITSTHGGSL